MKIDLEKIRRETEERLGGPTDLSWLTEEMVLEATEKATEAKRTLPTEQTHTDGNSVYFNAGSWYWRPHCDSHPLLRWGNPNGFRATRLSNCLTGALHYDIDYW